MDIASAQFSVEIGSVDPLAFGFFARGCRPALGNILVGAIDWDEVAVEQSNYLIVRERTLSQAKGPASTAAPVDAAIVRE